MSDLPSSLKIGAFTISILGQDRDSDAEDYGSFSHRNQAIHLSGQFANEQLRAVTLLHEIHHAIWWAQNIKPRDGEERIVDSLSSGFAQVWRDNPELIAYLGAALK
jgi:hypothetical protein